MDTSLNICFSGMKFVMVVHIPLEGTMSHILDLGLSFYVKKTGNFWSLFKTLFSRFHKKETKT